MLYRVPLYIPGVHREVLVMRDLLVVWNSFGVFEIMTGKKIKLSTTFGLMDYYQCSREYGYGAFVKKTDFNVYNRVPCTSELLMQYIDSFSESNFELFCSIGKSVRKEKRKPTNVRKLSKMTNYSILVEER